MSKYWQERSMQKERLIQGYTTSAINRITAVYDKAVEDIKNEIKRVFTAYKISGKLSNEEALRLLNGAEKSELIRQLKQNLNNISDEKIRSEILNRINAIAYFARITRLEALQERVEVIFKQMTDSEIGTDKYVLANAYKESYYRTIFDCQQGFGIGADFALIPEKALQTVLESKFKGKNFSKRIWINTNVLANKLKTVLGAGIASGASIEKMSNDIADLSLKGKAAATRLIRTETTFYMGQGELKAYSELGIDKYKYLATLDSRTSPMCAELDGKVFNVADAAAGVNYPPLHPWCRSTTVAYFEDGKGTRIARDKDGGTYKVPSDMTYREWKEKYVDKSQREKYNEFIEKVHEEIKNGYNLNLNKGAQDKHIQGTNNYILGRSILNVDADMLIKKYAGNAEPLKTRKGEWNQKERFTHDEYIGFYVNKEGKMFPTKNGILHYSKNKGIHIVPANP